MRVLPTLLILLLSPLAAFSQNGTISGKVTDQTDGSTMPGVIVMRDSTGVKGTITDFDGNYNLPNVPPGIYTLTFRFTGYQQTQVSDIKVEAGKTAIANVALAQITLQGKTFVVVSVRQSNSIAAVTQEMQNSNSAVSGISGQQISKGQDPNAAEVVKRIPGVTIIDNRFIMVRGLNERYNNVWLNDAGAPSAETDKRAFSFDMVPSGVLDRIMIYKTPSPELPGDFAGGMVRIYTKAFPDKPVLNVSAQGLYREGTTFKNFNYAPGSPTDKWGFDNGYRSIPSDVDAYVSRTSPALTKSFVNDWGMNTKSAIPDGRFSLMYATPVHFGDSSNFSAGNTFGLGYSHAFTTYNIHRQDWDSTAQSADYTDIQSTETVRVSAVENFSLMNSSGHFKLEYKNLFNQVGKSSTTYRESNLLDGPNEKSYMFGYESRTIYSSQLSTQLKSKKENSVYTATAGFAYTERNAPDLRRIKYTKQRTDPDSMYAAQVANVVDPVNGGGRVYQWLMEQTWSFQQNFSQKFHLLDTVFEVNVGSYTELKNRLFIARVLGYTITPSFQAYMLKHLPVDQIFAPENVGGQGLFNLDEITSKSDQYAAQNKLMAGYGMIKAPIGKHLTVVTGLRYEYNEQALQGYVNLDSISPKIVTRFLLPSVNASYNFTPDMLVRAAWGKTLNRPEFREWSPFYFYDFDFRAGTYGSLFPTILAPQGQVLDVAKVDNYDLRFEWYPGSSDYLHVGVFYKTFVDPIQQVILNSGGSDSRAFTFINAQYAFVEGAELDLRKNLAFIDSATGGTAFGNFNIVTNLSIMKSRLYMDPAQVVNQAASTQLQGQSPYVVNAGIYYQNDSIGLNFSVLYNVFGPRLFLVGTLDYANIGELPRNTLDITISKKIIPCLSVMVSAQDLFNQPVQLVQDTNRNGKFERNGGATGDQEILNYRRGRYFAIGLTFTPGIDRKGK